MRINFDYMPNQLGMKLQVEVVKLVGIDMSKI